MDPFGNNFPNQDPNETGNQFVFNLRMSRQYWDIETGTDYNYFRDYDPSMGRYLQSDPLGLFGGQFSTYAYVGGKPINSIDPFGLVDINLHIPGSAAWIAAKKIPSPPDTCTVGAHGNSSWVVDQRHAQAPLYLGEGLYARDLAIIIKDAMQPGQKCEGKTKVQIYSCNAGEAQYGQQIANELQLPVGGPNKLLFTWQSGRTPVIADPTRATANTEHKLPDYSRLGTWIWSSPDPNF